MFGLISIRQSSKFIYNTIHHITLLPIVLDGISRWPLIQCVIVVYTSLQSHSAWREESCVMKQLVDTRSEFSARYTISSVYMRRPAFANKWRSKHAAGAVVWPVAHYWTHCTTNYSMGNLTRGNTTANSQS